MNIRFFRKPAIADDIYAFNRRLSFGVFILARQGLSKEQISSRLWMNIHQVDQILAVKRVRDGVVKKIVESFNNFVCRMGMVLVHTRLVDVFWPFISRVHNLTRNDRRDDGRSYL